MNAEPAAPHSFPELPPASRWSWKKTGLVIVFAFAAHVAFIFLLGAKKVAAPRAVTNVPVFRLADNSSELIRLTDPTLFALPHAEDFSSAVWAQPADDLQPVFGWTAMEPAHYLPPDTTTLGAAFNTFVQTNRFAVQRPDFKPAPQIIMPQVNIVSVLPQNSTWQLAGEIAGRKILSSIAAPTLALNDVIAPSRAQLLVDENGRVVSAVLLETSGYDAADQKALELARTLRFFPAAKPMFGEIIFNWHTVPASAP